MENVFIAAGGTGGHINAALSLEEVLKTDYNVVFLSGERHLDYKLFAGKNCLHIKSRPLRSRNPISLGVNLILNAVVFIKLYWLFLLKKPKFVIGAGGYVCGPSLLAAKLQFRPIFIIEQNAVAGMTNKLLSYIANLIFTNFEQTKGLPQRVKNRIRNHGNPIRQNITFNKNKVGEELNILIFGGSLGATQINEAVKNVLEQNFSKSLNIVHQVGKDNLFEVENVDKSINYKQVEYIDDMDKQYHWANIIISRAGASTISELRVVKKPALLIPYPAAVDNHQYYNAENLKKENLSFIEVLDHTQPATDLAKAIVLNINKINSQNLFYSDSRVVNNAVDGIVEEIKNYVRNK